MAFNKRLNALFKATGIKKNDLPGKIGMGRTTLFNYLAGRTEPTLTFFQATKTAFPWVNIEWLITGGGAMIIPTVGALGTNDAGCLPTADVVAEKILLMLDKMPEERRIEVLRYAKEREQLAGMWAEGWDDKKEDRRVCPRGERRRAQ